MVGGAARSEAARYSAGARAYADWWAPVLLPFNLRLVAELPLAAARRVLDIATGVGSLLPALAAAAPRAQVVGIDLAPGMVALAPRGFGLAVCDAARLGLADACFDAAVMPFAIFHMADPDAALAEVARVLRPGGACGLTSWYGEPHFAAHDAWLAETRAYGAAPGRWPTEVIHPEALQRALERAGLAAVRITVGRFDYRHDPRRFLELRLAMAQPWLAGLAAEARAELVAGLTARLAALAADGFVDPTPILYAVARRP